MEYKEEIMIINKYTLSKKVNIQFVIEEKNHTYTFEKLSDAISFLKQKKIYFDSKHE